MSALRYPSSSFHAPAWILCQDAQRFGPFTSAEMLSLVSEGRVARSAIVERVGDSGRRLPFVVALDLIKEGAGLNARKGLSRVPLDAKVIVVDSERLAIGYSVNVSSSGVLVDFGSDTTFPVDQPVKVIMKSSDLSRPIRANARIARDPGNGSLGIEFQVWFEAGQAVVDRYIERYLVNLHGAGGAA